jgi:cytochrome c oxidase subunit 2
MRRLVRIVPESEYKDWLKEQQSYYMSSIYQTESDPWPIDGRLPSIVSTTRKQEFTDLFDTAFKGNTGDERTFVLKYVTFETGSAGLTELSKKYELANVIDVMKQYPDLVISLGGHTDNTGDAAANMTLSQQRADAVMAYLTANGIPASRLRAVGYGQNAPIADNDTDAGRAQNRRTAFTIVSGGKPASVAPVVEAAATE